MVKLKVEIPEEIIKKLKERVDSADEFKDVEEYVNYILKQVVERLDTEKEEKKESKEETYSQEDEEKVKERLRSLGYLD